MDVLHEIERSNGRSVVLLSHEHTAVGKERDRYYLRGFNYGNPGECLTLYLTAEEIDRLHAAVHAPPSQLTEDQSVIDSVFSTLRKLSTIRRR